MHIKSEIQLQATAYQWAYNTYPQLRKCLFHVPNGGTRNKIEAMQLKASGVVAGIPDILLVWNRVLYPFEFKTPEGTLSDKQKEVHEAWALQGFPPETIRGLEQFQSRIIQILAL